MPDPASSNLKVPMELERAGHDINAKADQITQRLEDLKTQLGPISQTWTGTAKTHYEGLQGEWNLAADGLFGPTGVLGKIAYALNLSWANYSDCEWANVKTWLPTR
ncbi:WXG100 family type VII secretion target [Micromonospora sp. KLBMP9576]|uniref:WXG100 family type VII secretion target n=1 Tax=Micromonospora sp. KLBMP9576 TaxID=3424769 RepID=UPI003D91027C